MIRLMYEGGIGSEQERGREIESERDRERVKGRERERVKGRRYREREIKSITKGAWQERVKASHLCVEKVTQNYDKKRYT